jgi:arsenite methyltransferase
MGADMNSDTVKVYDPPLCCSTGICGPSVDPELVRFAADLQWLQSRGVSVERFNLAQQPGDFVDNPTILALMRAEEASCLPVVMVGDTVIAKQAYPSRDELSAHLHLAEEA